jgi:hypothetical protein
MLRQILEDVKKYQDEGQVYAEQTSSGESSWYDCIRQRSYQMFQNRLNQSLKYFDTYVQPIEIFLA